MTPRFLFHCRNTTGLGHLMRGRNIARALRELAPAAQIVFTGNADSVAPVLGEFPYLPSLTYADVAHVKPDVLVFDTLLPKWQIPPDVALAYVMRKIRPDKRHRFLNDPLLDRAVSILVPHTRSEYADELPPHLQRKACWAGPIVRVPSPEVQRSLTAKYRIEDDAFVLTSTAGGGAGRESAFFFDTIAEVHRRLQGVIPRLRHFVVTGPYFTGALPALDGWTPLRFEPAINDLFALSDLVIAEGGYNTVHEIQLARVPAVFLPARRKLDHQEERVRALEQRGLCAVIPHSSSTAVEAIVRVCLTQSCREQMRASYLHHRIETGNGIAAATLLEAATQACLATCHD